MHQYKLRTNLFAKSNQLCPINVYEQKFASSEKKVKRGLKL